ncbi:MAG: succinate--CoA ligase subunit alpha [Myxococcota bacterium]|jgi:succinyl-CoA synthetase alpha subunit|nr:succinate--CoA ligase subunit alpha [Myxococcota bacterium]MBP8970432.1 succinate--CoA ligase subunit alpha [Myxococcota bacterium]OQC37387.1 MAG: Succinyl-CoA ligase (ADP-forming) subunit alpha [Deltaproteobacteria bacterium ADurb.Bin058]HHW97092.1 succinate--CoA ligase subunit alpha [Oligoflexales bacterium]HQL56057.1 succinate--CoA ligase subunit alpha [Myxococcota bacterium]
MSIYVDENTRVIVQGITGSAGAYHARSMRDYGTKVVGGVTPGRKGTFVDEIPVFDSVRQAVSETGANTSVIFVPAAYAKDAMLEAVDAGIELVCCITEGIPVLDMMAVKTVFDLAGARLIGPNCPGVISPGKCKVGIMPGHIHMPGDVGVVSRSGTLTYEAVAQLTALGIGQSTGIGIGGDPINGTSFIDVLTAFQEDPDTSAVVLIGEIGGGAEEQAAKFVKDNMDKPVIAFIAGRTAPPGRRMGHAGAIISGGKGTAEEKVAILRDHGIEVAQTPADIGITLARRIGRA